MKNEPKYMSLNAYNILKSNALNFFKRGKYITNSFLNSNMYNKNTVMN